MTLLGQLLPEAAIVVMDEQPDGPDVILELLGERQGLSHQSCDSLPQGVVQALDLSQRWWRSTEECLPAAVVNQGVATLNLILPRPIRLKPGKPHQWRCSASK